MNEFECQTRMGVLRGKCWGDLQKPVVLALHGWLDNCESFAEFYGNTNFYWIALDLPGHGKSDWLGLGAEYSIWSSLAPLVDVCDTHEWLKGRSFSVLGHSMGGAIGVLLASVLAERVSSLITLDSFGPYTYATDEVATQLRKAVLEPMPNVGRSYACIEDALATRVKNSRGASAACLSGIVERNLNVNDGEYQWATDPRLRLSSAVRFTEEALHIILKTLTMPVYVFRAEQGIMPLTTLQDRLLHVRNGQLQTLVGHHHFHLEKDTAKAVVTAVESVLGHVAIP